MSRIYVNGKYCDFMCFTEETMASKKKGLSLEEKRKKMMEIFFESKDVFLLKGTIDNTYLL